MVEWPDTDAAGHYHHSTIVRWVEAAEAALHERLGTADLFGVIPRVSYRVDYTDRLFFLDRVLVELWVAEVGRASVRYQFVVRRAAGEPGQVAAHGELTAVLIDPEAGRSAPWPEAVRERLAGSAPAATDLAIS